MTACGRDPVCIASCPRSECSGSPYWVRFVDPVDGGPAGEVDVDDRFTVIEWFDLGEEGPFPGPERREIARLHVRLGEDPPVAASILAGTFTVGEGAFAKTFESGGLFVPPDPIVPFAPAREVDGGTVYLAGHGGFIRGDVNSDARMDLSDPISLLLFLFVDGDEPRCRDGGDADDNGKLEVTDAIYILHALFLGGRDPAPPHPGCGVDPTDDDLPCATLCPEEG